jgi:hypothetical protein
MFTAMAPVGSSEVVLFSGTDLTNGFPNDTWTFGGASWTQLSLPGPSARYGHAMAALP